MKTRGYSSTYSDKSDRRRKQKRDYATRKRLEEKRVLEELHCDNIQLYHQRQRRKDQIEKLKSWAMYAKTYLSLCTQMLVCRPASTAWQNGQCCASFSVTSNANVMSEAKVMAEAEVTSSSWTFPDSTVIKTRGVAASDVNGDMCTSSTNIHQPEDTGLETEQSAQQKASPTEDATLAAPDSTVMSSEEDLNHVQVQDLKVLVLDALRESGPRVQAEDVCSSSSSTPVENTVVGETLCVSFSGEEFFAESFGRGGLARTFQIANGLT